MRLNLLFGVSRHENQQTKQQYISGLSQKSKNFPLTKTICEGDLRSETKIRTGDQNRFS